jgi:hypothetical protein
VKKNELVLCAKHVKHLQHPRTLELDIIKVSHINSEVDKTYSCVDSQEKKSQRNHDGTTG